jgi:hypothetical protein
MPPPAPYKGRLEVPLPTGLYPKPSPRRYSREPTSVGVLATSAAGKARQRPAPPVAQSRDEAVLAAFTVVLLVAAHDCCAATPLGPTPLACLYHSGCSTTSPPARRYRYGHII